MMHHLSQKHKIATRVELPVLFIFLLWFVSSWTFNRPQSVLFIYVYHFFNPYHHFSPLLPSAADYGVMVLMLRTR